jgi:hypothetical protein
MVLLLQEVRMITCVQKNVWSSGLVLAFVSVTVWRNFSCQIFCETGGERPSIRITETVKRVREIIIK